MPVEIERAFVTDDLPDPAQLGPGESLRQGYVASEDGVEVRVRLCGTHATLTVKSPSALVRTEVEVALAPDAAEALWELTRGRRLAKTRHRVGIGAHTAEVDLYEGALAGLCRIEVEFATPEEAAAFRPPAWFGREVTGEPGWGNERLARHGRPDRR